MYQTTGLSFGPHNYYFYFEDGHGGSSKLPSSGTYSGPTVITSANIPWCDNFPSTTLDATKWPVNTGAIVNDLGLTEPSIFYSLNLNNKDTVESQYIDLSAESNISLSYYWERTGRGESPEPGDDLFVEYYTSSGYWDILNQHYGSGYTMAHYDFEEIALPSDAYHGGFRVRFRANCDSTDDDWFVDDVCILTIPCTCNVTCNPDNTTVSQGGMLGYTVCVTCTRAKDIKEESDSFYYYTNVTLPNGNIRWLIEYGPVTVDCGEQRCEHIKTEFQTMHLLVTIRTTHS